MESQLQRHSPTVSVIIPAYNSEDTVAETIASVLGQTFADFELIIVDDGSTDGTEAVIRRFEDSRLRLVTQANGGPSAARNAAIALSQGTYLAFLDADDCWHPDKLDHHLAFVRAHEARASFTWVEVHNDDGSPEEAADIAAWFNRTCPSQAEMVARFFASGNFLCASTALIERELVLAAGGFCLTSIQTQDFELWSRLLKVTPLEILAEPLTMYRRRSQASNLTYDPANSARIQFEVQQIYRTMFAGMPAALFDAAFPQRQRTAAHPSAAVLELEQAFLLLEHSEAWVRYLGLEQLYTLLQAPEMVETAAAQYAFTLPDFFALTRAAPSADPTQASITDLREQVQKRNEEIRWQDEQRQAWQLLAEERGQTIVRYYAQAAESAQKPS